MVGLAFVLGAAVAFACADFAHALPSPLLQHDARFPRPGGQSGIAYDRQWVNPKPTPADTKADWWWMNAQANSGVNGKAPANVQVVFYQGYVFPVPTDLPKYYVSVEGSFPNGTTFGYTLFATDSVVTTQDTTSTGNWAGVGQFRSKPGKTYQVTFANDFVNGAIQLDVDTPPHFSCNTTTSPFFDSVAPSSLTAEEEVLFKRIGWAVSAPNAKAKVSLTIEGAPLVFIGTGYHDQNFVDSSTYFANSISEWLFGSAEVGPYAFSYLATRAHNSQWTFTTGFLSKNGVILQNQCSTVATSSIPGSQPGPNRSKVTPWGVKVSPGSGVNVPKGYVVDYTLSDGKTYRFNLTETAEILDIPIYHRSIGPVSGGKVGEPAQNGVVLFEWLNPGVNVYDP
ncbi:hypothetical protein BXZ70DRAFT_1072999 [Cristinia sonorae]|uniref:Uncharacterized protein n=1 Tax=Cristinia sonorae TaxID=1940300 RepID=A0A8K0UJ06_9AGAR|nr:hypothetical protein BXZ70DRAFT_1072999 [Cristinia sonorae]